MIMFSFIETRIFGRLVQEYLSDDEYRAFQEALRMAKTKRNIGREILDGLREIKRGKHARVVNVPDVSKIRKKTGLSQARFAELLGVSVRTLQDWEQGRRAPSGAARTLLLIADRDPTVLLKVA